MATTAVTPTRLALNTLSASITDASGVVATTPADGWAISLGSRGTAEQLLLKFVGDASGDTTVTVLAGDRPPSSLAALGNLVFAVGANEARHIVVESARFLQDDNTIVVTCVDAGTKCNAFLMPVATAGGSGIA